MLNKTLWVLDNEMDPKKFERLCVDLLYRNGYKEIIPFGGMHDHGRDAEINISSAINKSGEIVFFQFSLQKDWKKKLRDELEKVKKYGHTITRFILMTSRDVSGKDKDNLKSEVLNEYGWKLEILPREWLRLQLEEANPDLAQKYLGIQLPEPSQKFYTPFQLTEQFKEQAQAAWFYYRQGDYERAVVELKAYLLSNPDKTSAWKALAWSEYQLFRYEEALASINRSLKIDKTDNETNEIRACILAEYGISINDRASLLEAKDIFRKQPARFDEWTTFYNYGNTLSALGEYKEAIEQYKKALGCDSSIPEIWKNLGSAYHNIGNHKAELDCFDKALEIDSQHPIVLMSKGCTLLVDFEQALEGAQLIERALQIDENLSIRWPHVWYWLCEAYSTINDLDRALFWVDEGLLHSPSHRGLQLQKARIFSMLWKENSDYISKATKYFEFLVELDPYDYSSRQELVELYSYQNLDQKAWGCLQDSFKLLEIEGNGSLKNSGFTIEECSVALRFLPYYSNFRQQVLISEYWKFNDPELGVLTKLARNQGFEDLFYIYSAIPFGLGYAKISTRPVEERDKKVIFSFFEVIRNGLEKCIPKSAREFASAIPKDGDKVGIASILGEIIVFLSFVALLESSKQRGWIAGYLGIDKKDLFAVMDEYEEQKIMGKVAEASLREINDVTKIFPEEPK